MKNFKNRSVKNLQRLMPQRALFPKSCPIQSLSIPLAISGSRYAVYSKSLNSLETLEGTAMPFAFASLSIVQASVNIDTADILIIFMLQIGYAVLFMLL